MSVLPTERAHRLALDDVQHEWLVDELWSEAAVGIVGGEPKCCKSFLALDLAISVAGGRPCLGRFAVERPGRVLLFAAEDAPAVVRNRFEGIAAARGARLEDLDIEVITAPTVRLDVDADREQLRNTVAKFAPRLLVLDPFVRLHRVDENASKEVAPILAFLRELNREYGAAVVLVHHSRKSGGLRPGQALRGSSEFHAWGDSNLYLRRRGERIELGIEHRAAASSEPLTLELAVGEAGPALTVVDSSAATAATGAGVARTRRERVVEALREVDGPAHVAKLREVARMRTQTLVDELHDMLDGGKVGHSEEGYWLRD